MANNYIIWLLETKVKLGELNFNISVFISEHEIESQKDKYEKTIEDLGTR